MVVSGALVAVWGSGLQFSGDEWSYASRLADEPTVEAILNPPARKYLIVLPLLVYELLLETAGPDHYLPFRLLGIALVLLNAGLVFALLRPRTGTAAALAPALVLLFLGAAAPVTVQPLRVPGLIAVAAGLGSWLALDKRGRGRDLTACVLTAVAVTSHPIGLAFAVGTAARVTLREPRRPPSGWWIFAVPLALFAAWFVLGRTPDEGGSTLDVGDWPAFAWESLLAAAAAVTGAFRDPLDGEVLLTGAGAYLAVAAAVALVVWGIRRQGRLTPALAGAAVALGAALLAPVLAEGPERIAGNARYLYPNAVLLMVVCGLAVAGSRPGRVALAALAALCAFSLFQNITVMEEETEEFVAQSEAMRGELTALDLAGEQVNLEYRPARDPARPRQPGPRFRGSAGTYFRVEGAYGSPARSPAELAARGLRDREIADAALIGALGLEVEPAAGAGARCGDPQAVAGLVELNPGRYLVSAPPGGEADITAGRFAPPQGAVRIGEIEAGASGAVELPADASPRPWLLDVRERATIRACP